MLDEASSINHVTFTTESTFTETGTVTLGDGAVDVTTVGVGTLGPSAEAGVLQGAVVWRVTEGRGAFAGTMGIITVNFVLRPANGTFEERPTPAATASSRSYSTSTATTSAPMPIPSRKRLR